MGAAPPRPPAAHSTHLHKLHLQLRLPQLPDCSLPPCWTLHCRPRKPCLLPQCLHCLLSFPLGFDSLFLLAKPAGLPPPKQPLLTCHQELTAYLGKQILTIQEMCYKIGIGKMEDESSRVLPGIQSQDPLGVGDSQAVLCCATPRLPVSGNTFSPDSNLRHPRFCTALDAEMLFAGSRG